MESPVLLFFVFNPFYLRPSYAKACMVVCSIPKRGLIIALYIGISHYLRSFS